MYYNDIMMELFFVLSRHFILVFSAVCQINNRMFIIF